ncbi:MAG: hypothetical protein PHE02_12035 [Lachnospiraceae bacterium]|nr:hypothetical protein [Lachnospiraceae bacterium]
MDVILIRENNIQEFECMIPKFQRERERGVDRICLGLRDGDFPCGILIFYLFKNEDYHLMASIQWIYVLSEYRGGSGATDLIRVMMRIFENQGVHGASCYLSGGSREKDHMINLLLPQGFSLYLHQKEHYEITYEEAIELPVFHKLQKTTLGKNVLPMGWVSKPAIRSFEQGMTGNENYFADRISKENYDFSISMAYMEEETIKAVILWRNEKAAGLYLDFLYSRCNRPEALYQLVGTSIYEIRAYINTLTEEERRKRTVCVDALNSKTEKIIKAFMGDRTGTDNQQYQLLWIKER